MILWMLVLLLFQLAGELIARTFQLPLPGPVIGMLLLFAALMIRGSAPVGLRNLSHALLQHLSLLFVPAGVGIIAYLGLISQLWLPVLAVLVVSTLLTLAVTALVFRWLQRVTHTTSSEVGNGWRAD